MKEYGLALSKAIGSADAELINLVLLDAKAELPSAEFFEMLLPHPQATPRPDMLSFGCGASSPSPLAAHSGFVCGVCVRSLVRVSSVSSLVFRQSARPNFVSRLSSSGSRAFRRRSSSSSRTARHVTTACSRSSSSTTSTCPSRPLPSSSRKPTGRLDGRSVCEA